MRHPSALGFVVLLFTGSGGAQYSVSKLQHPPEQTGTGVIEGTVVNALTHEPIKKAQVALNGPFYLAAVTDAAGHFAFKDLPEGGYTVQLNQMRGNGANFDPRSQTIRKVTLPADGKINDITLSILPPGSVSGRIVDEDGTPVSGCNVSAALAKARTPDGGLMQVANGQTNEAGEYHMQDMAAGKYKVMAYCYRTKVLPHAFIERSADVDIPTQLYAPQFYPGASDLTGASTIVVAAGSDVTGIDFRMAPTTGITIRGRVSEGASDGERLFVNLEARDPQQRDLLRNGTQVEKGGKFALRDVLPGAYQLVCFTQGQGPFLYARIPVDVGSEPMEPIVLTLAAPLTLTGTVITDDDSKPLEKVQVMLDRVTQLNLPRRQSLAEVQKDGTFVVSDIVPEKWTVFVNNYPGFIKSLSLNDQEAAGTELDLSQAAGGKLRIVMSTKFGQIEGTVSGRSGTGAVAGIVWLDGAETHNGFRTSFNVDDRNSFRFDRLPPGKYHACAIDGIGQPWMLLNDFALLKKLESRCEVFEVTEGSKATIQVPQITSEDLASLMEQQ